MALQKLDLGSVIGPQGPNGNAYVSFKVNSEGDLIQTFEDGEVAPTFRLSNDGDLEYVLDNGTSVNLGHVKGDKGDPGEAGSLPTGGQEGQVLGIVNGEIAWVTPTEPIYPKLEIDEANNTLNVTYAAGSRIVE